MDKEQAAFFKRFGATIRKTRLEKGMTLEDMGGHGFSPPHFQKIEAGKKAVGVYTALRIAKAFRMTLSDMFKSLE